MSHEKIYYSIVVLLAAISVLLSPFFHIHRGRRAPTPAPKRRWLPIIIANSIMVAALLAAWWFWLR